MTGGPTLTGLTATAAVCDDKPQYSRKVYGCVTLAWNEPVIDARTVLERMEYRFAESGFGAARQVAARAQ